MFEEHIMTDASYLIPSHLDVWRLHSLNGLSTENNSHHWFQLITTIFCCYADGHEPNSICSVLNVSSILTEGNEIWRRDLHNLLTSRMILEFATCCATSP
jgi:hypothetical protein